MWTPPLLSSLSTPDPLVYVLSQSVEDEFAKMARKVGRKRKTKRRRIVRHE